MMALVDLAKNGHFLGALKRATGQSGELEFNERETDREGRGGSFRYGSLKHQSGLC